MNNILLASFFTPSQTLTVITVAAAVVLLIVLNIVLAYIFNKRGERKLYDRLLQQQRELLMKQLDDMRTNGADGEGNEEYKPFFTNELPDRNAAAAAAAEEEEQLVKVSDIVPPAEEVTENEAPSESIVELEETDDADESVFAEMVAAEENEEEVAEEVIINGVVVRYNRSYTARIIQASEELKNRYSELKNYLLSYAGVKNRISWKRESFRFGRNTFASFVVRGKTLCMCLSVEPEKFADTKYKVIDLRVRSPKAKLPTMYRISSPRRVKFAKEIIDSLMDELGLALTEGYIGQDYLLPYEQTPALIERDLIRIVGGNAHVLEEIVLSEIPAPAAELDEKQQLEVAEEQPAEVVEEQPAEVAEEQPEEVTEQPEEVVEEQPAEVAEEQPEEVIEQSEEVAEEQPEETLVPREFEILEEVAVSEVENVMSDEEAEELVEEKVVKVYRAVNKKRGIVNIDALSKNFEAGAYITIEMLKERNLIAKEINVLKVLAKGTLNKPLIVEADDFSLEAVKMIVLTGGRVIRRKLN